MRRRVAAFRPGCPGGGRETLRAMAFRADHAGSSDLGIEPTEGDDFVDLADAPGPADDLGESPSSAVRERAADQRDRVAEDRELAVSRRERAADERDRLAAARDECAEGRDQVAGLADREAEGRDRAAASRELLLPPEELERSGALRRELGRSAALRRDAASDRRRSAADRVFSSAERLYAGADRAGAALDREAAASERSATVLDDLTGTYRRGPGFVALDREVARAKRTHEPLVLAFIDVVGLKAVNDSGGHARGDELLRAVAETLRAHLRPYDPIVRYGGDEFVCLLSGLDLLGAAHRLAAVNVSLAGPRRTAVTIGLAELELDESLEALLSRADDALYHQRHHTVDARIVPRPRDWLAQLCEEAGLSHFELWVRYFELGGMATPLELEAYLLGALQPSTREGDLVAHTLKERLAELGRGHPSSGPVRGV